VSDADIFSAFVGRWVELRPADRAGALRVTKTELQRWDRPLEVAVISRTGNSQLRLGTKDRRVLDLADRAVYAEFSSSEALFRVRGMLEIVDHHPPSTICMLMPFEHPEAIQRREWVRVRTVLPVEIATCKRSAGDGKVIRTTSVDVSGGGIKLRDGLGVGVGSKVILAVELPSGPVEIGAEVLEIEPDGATRLRFLKVPESARRRIVRHIFDAQIETRKNNRGSSG